jgi:hypothetical protein
MKELRKKEVCLHCGGDKLRFKRDDQVRIICLICGKDFLARREDDLHRFHKLADIWHD